MKQTTGTKQMHVANDWGHPVNRLSQVFLISSAIAVAGATAAAVHKQVERNHAPKAVTSAAPASRLR